jgi:hypothetical protein
LSLLFSEDSAVDDIRTPIAARPARFLDQLRVLMRERQLAGPTEKTYLYWIRKYIQYHNRRHADITTTEIYTHVLNKGGRGVTGPLG